MKKPLITQATWLQNAQWLLTHTRRPDPPRGAMQTAPLIELYSWPTPNGAKVAIFLEEAGLAYRYHPVNIGAGDARKAAHLARAPSGKIPAIRDCQTGQTLMESGAILLYLSEKTGLFLPKGQDRWAAMDWLCWQVAEFGPTLGQTHHFVKFHPNKSERAKAHFISRASETYAQLERQLRGRDYIAGPARGTYSIVDMAVFPWVARHAWQGVDITRMPNLRDWAFRLWQRPALRRGYRLGRKPKDGTPVF